MRKIKIAQVITRMDWGGSPDVLRILCQRLDPNLYDIRIIIGRTNNPTAKTKDFLKQFQEKIIFIPRLQREINPFNDIAALINLRSLFLKEKFDIVHTHTAKAGALGRLAAHFCSVPAVIHTPHGHNFYGYFNKFLSWLIIIIEKTLTHFTDKIMVLTELERNDYLRYGVSPEKKLVLIYTGLELKKFNPVMADSVKLKENLGINSNIDTVGFIGRLENIKGPQYFLGAARSVLSKRSNTKFILVGEGSLRGSLETQVKAWGLNDRIIFIGWRDDIAAIMSVLDLLVLPSLNEAVGIVLIEAQSQGLPVIASRVGGIPETVKDQQTGILVDPKNIDAIAEAILTLLDDPRKRQFMSQQAQEWVKDRFKAEKMVEQVAATYAGMLGNKHVIT